MHTKSSGWSRSLSGIGTTASSSTKWTEDYAMPSLPNEGLEDLNREDASEDGNNFDNILISPNSSSPTTDASYRRRQSPARQRQIRENRKSLRGSTVACAYTGLAFAAVWDRDSPSTSSIIDGSIGNSSSVTRHVEQYEETDEVNEVS